MWILIGLWTYDQDRLIMTFGLHDTDITCTTLHLSDITCTTLYLLLPPFTLSRDLDTHYIHYLSLIFMVSIPDPVTLSNTLFCICID